VLVVLMGSGIGAVNEIIEFIAVKSVPETNVGGYDNTLWDLIFNLFGGSSRSRGSPSDAIVGRTDRRRGR